MSSSSTATVQGPLTTIFTPPSGCFDTVPQTFAETLCWPERGCYWSLPDHCYPPGAGENISTLYNGVTIVDKYSYSPGVIPSGFWTAYRTFPAHDGPSAATVAIGCPSHFLVGTGGAFCTSQTVAKNPVSISGSGEISYITIVLPQLAASWHESDLSKFTPRAAPTLPGSQIAAYESRLRSSRSTGPRQTEPPPTPAGTLPGQTNVATSDSQGPGLTTGAKAGIGVGVTVAVLLLIAVSLLIWRRTRHSKKAGLPEKRPYLDAKAELDDSRRQRDAPAIEMSHQREIGELETTERPQELSINREPPPIPYASKPR